MYDVNVIQRLIDIEKKILKSFVKLCYYRNNSNLFYKEMSFLKDVLLKKEDILISKLPVSDFDLDNILNDIIDNKSILFDNKYVYYFVSKRISSIIFSLIDSLDDEIYSDDDYEILDSPINRRKIDENLSAQLLNSISIIFQNEIDLQEMFEIIKYYEVFIFKELSEKVISNGFDFESVQFLKDSDLCYKLDLDNEDYYSLKNDEIYHCLEDLTFDLLEVFTDGDESYVLSYMLFKFKFLIHNISDSGLSIFSKYFCDTVLPVIDSDIIQGFVFALNFELENRGINTNYNNPSIDDENLSYLIDLIKIEGSIYELYNMIDFDNIDGNILSCLRSLVSLEGCLISKIQIDQNNEDVIKSMFGEDLSFFLSFEEEELSLISKRLFNSIPYFKEKNVSPTQSFLSYDYIRMNHVVRSLKKFTFALDDNDNYFKFFKDIIFVNDFLTFDFLTTGNYMMFEDLSDSLVCDILDVKDVEYSFDKNEQLIALADEIILDISIYNGDDDAYVFFRLAELEDIMESLSDEYLSELKDNVIPNGFYDKKIVKKLRKSLKR